MMVEVGVRVHIYCTCIYYNVFTESLCVVCLCVCECIRVSVYSQMIENPTGRIPESSGV